MKLTKYDREQIDEAFDDLQIRVWELASNVDVFLSWNNQIEHLSETFGKNADEIIEYFKEFMYGKYKHSVQKYAVMCRMMNMSVIFKSADAANPYYFRDISKGCYIGMKCDGTIVLGTNIWTNRSLYSLDAILRQPVDFDHPTGRIYRVLTYLIEKNKSYGIKKDWPREFTKEEWQTVLESILWRNKQYDGIPRIWKFTDEHE